MGFLFSDAFGCTNHHLSAGGCLPAGLGKHPAGLAGDHPGFDPQLSLRDLAVAPPGRPRGTRIPGKKRPALAGADTGILENFDKSFIRLIKKLQGGGIIIC